MRPCRWVLAVPESSNIRTVSELEGKRIATEAVNITGEFLKKHGVSKKPLRQGESLRARVQYDLERIRRAPALVRSFFRAPSVAYATD